MKTKEKKQIDIWKVVNIDKETNEIQMLDYLFDHGDGFKGATGTRFEPISKAEYKQRTSKKEVIQRIINCYDETSYNKAKKLYKEMKQVGEIESFVFDLSYANLWYKLREYGYNEKDYPVFECIGGGRMFDENFQGNVNPELSKEIQKYEKKTKK